MAERVLQYAATIPAGTAIDAPAEVSFPLDNWDIEAIDLEVPPGPAGAMGFYLANNSQPWIPRNAGEWLIWDDRQATIHPTGYPAASGWAIVGYNLGTYDHGVTVRFHVNPVEPPQPAATPLVITFVERDIPESYPVIV